MRRLTAASIGMLLLALLVPAPASWAHGDEEEAEPAAGSAVTAEEAEMADLVQQPARVLAQQALAMLEVTGDDLEAGERVEAALESDDQDDVDIAKLEESARALEAGDHEAAIPLLDAALSRPLGAESGKALHEAGRDFEPGTGAQEVVAIVVGAALLGLGVLALAPWRRRRPAA